MPRQPRLHVPGAFYFVTARGNQDNNIFFRDIEGDLMDEIVEEALDSCGASLHAFCWMTNHLHLLVQVSDQPLGALMQRIGSRFSRAIQRKRAKKGHLFQNRYHALLLDVDEYLPQILRYIHLRPVRSGAVIDPREYPWSSHLNYVGLRVQRWVKTDFALSCFHRHPDEARRLYQASLEDEPSATSGDELPKPNPSEQRVLGDADFLSRLDLTPVTRANEMTIESIAGSVCDDLGVSLEEVRSPSQAHVACRARGQIAAAALQRSVASLSETARFLNRTASAVSRAAARYGRRITKIEEEESDDEDDEDDQDMVGPRVKHNASCA
jgi:putative transposase